MLDANRTVSRPRARFRNDQIRGDLVEIVLQQVGESSPRLSSRSLHENRHCGRWHCSRSHCHNHLDILSTRCSASDIVCSCSYRSKGGLLIEKAPSWTAGHIFESFLQAQGHCKTIYVVRGRSERMLSGGGYQKWFTHPPDQVGEVKGMTGVRDLRRRLLHLPDPYNARLSVRKPCMYPYSTECSSNLTIRIALTSNCIEVDAAVHGCPQRLAKSRRRRLRDMMLLEA